MDRTIIKNARVITPEGIFEGGSILIEGSKISLVSKTDICAENCRMIDAGGAYASPGFIDLHTHGAGGHD
ncbi:MAG: N-acetylglucosamine-6-phosphate deacetylase, partial [Eubacteriales bacterium]|nr:N-acetylglucosamine-6-phosphate deacetylase [Eubacteriales bacterium]